MTKSPTNLRALACKTVHQVVHDQQSLASLMPEASREIASKDKGLFQELVFGTCRWYFSLEHIHNQFLKKPLSKQDAIASTLLKVGAYQLLWMRIPTHAAINETVEAAKQLGQNKLSGLINAVLRKISSLSLEADAEQARMSHPIWLQEKISHNWPEHARSIFEQNNTHPPMTLRVNTQKSTPKDYLDLLVKHEIEAAPCSYAPNGISLVTPCDVKQLPFFDDGFVSVQDEAAQLCCDLLDLAPNLNVLDACAAPGGKTCAMLETEPTLAVTALDSDAKRSTRIKENLNRLSLKASVLVADALKPDTWWNGDRYDRILLDAPCSATGVIRRHPDIKLLRKQDDIKQLADIQLKLLHSLWPSLKENGKLLYATCSIFPQENSRVIERFLKQENTAKLEQIKSEWGIDTGFGRQLMPQKNGHDGFFYACLRKC